MPARLTLRTCATLVTGVLAAAATLAPRALPADPWPDLAIPPENAAALRRAPPRPPPGDVAARAQHLAAALGDGNADQALDFFLPLQPFLAIKDMRTAAQYHARLIREYRQDIAAYRATLPAGQPVTFVRFEPSSQCVWMTIGREANRLPYWSCYHSTLVVAAGGHEHRLRVQVLINWGQQWYVTHLDRPRSHAAAGADAGTAH